MVEVEPPPAKPGDAAYEEADDAWGCQYCGSREDEDRMLLCDGCDAAWHLWCLNPPLTCVPTGDWYCQQCEPIGQARRREQARRRLHSAIADLYADEGEADGSNAPAPRPDGSSTSGVTAASMTTATGPTMAEEAAPSSSSSTYRISRRRLQARRQEPGLPIGAAASSSSAITLAEAWCSAAGSAGARCAMCSAEGCPGHFPPRHAHARTNVTTNPPRGPRGGFFHPPAPGEGLPDRRRERPLSHPPRGHPIRLVRPQQQQPLPSQLPPQQQQPSQQPPPQQQPSQQPPRTCPQFPQLLVQQQPQPPQQPLLQPSQQPWPRQQQPLRSQQPLPSEHQSQQSMLPLPPPPEAAHAAAEKGSERKRDEARRDDDSLRAYLRRELTSLELSLSGVPPLRESRREGILASAAAKLLQHYGGADAFFAGGSHGREPNPGVERKARVRNMLGKYLERG